MSDRTLIISMDWILASESNLLADFRLQRLWIVGIGKISDREVFTNHINNIIIDH